MNGEAKHTPGPWEVLGPHPTIHVGVMIDGGCVGEYPEPPTYESVCQVYLCPDFKTEASDEVKANARLIAESPDLLQALTELTQSASEFLAQVHPSVAPKNAEILRADIAKAREVISKAKGERP